MPPGVQFEDLVDRVRAGDQDAADELARMFEPFILRYVRFAMRKRRNFPVIRAAHGVFRHLPVGVPPGQGRGSRACLSPQGARRVACARRRKKAGPTS